jgi:hypothetical protein
MAKIRRLDSKAALAQQRAELKRGARGKAFVGDDSGSSAGRAAERAKVHRMQEQHEREEVERRQAEVERRQAEQRAREEWARVELEREHEERMNEPVSAIVADLVSDSLRLARTLLSFPFRMAVALWGHRFRASEG